MTSVDTIHEEIPVDRPADVYILLLDDSEDGLYRSDLADRLDHLDIEPFPFDLDVVDDYAAFMDALRFLDALDAIPELRERRILELTERGEAIAARLRDDLTDEQAAALEEADA